NRTFLPVSHRQPCPPSRMKGFPPDRHRLPRWLRWPATPLIGRPWRLQVAYRGGAGRPEHRAFAPGAQLLAKPGVTTQFIVTHHPAMRDLRAPQVEHFQALLLPGVVVHLLCCRCCQAPVDIFFPLPVLGTMSPRPEPSGDFG